MDGSSDMGLTLEGRVWTAHAKDTSKVPLFIGYSAMVGDNSGNSPVAGFTGTATSISTANPTFPLNPFNDNTDVAKKFRGQLYVNCLNNALTVGLYTDYINYGNDGFKVWNPKSSTVMDQAVQTMKFYAAYNSKWFGIGGEYVMQSMSNGEIETFAAKGSGTNDTTSAKQSGFSIFAHGTILQNCLNIFARYDSYTPDGDYSFATNSTEVSKGNPYGINETFTSAMSNVSSSGNGNYYKESFMNVGLDWTPTKDKKIHFMPNLWYYNIKAPYGSGDFASSNYILYRVTFLFAFN